MKKIFISRELKPSSPLKKALADHDMIDRSLINFSGLPIETPRADWIFFYSRNGVKYFFQEGNYALFPYLWACMSDGTAEELSQYINDISFVGNGNPEEVAKAYNEIARPNEVTCYIRAQNSQDSIHKLLSRKNDFSVPVYNNQINSELPDEKFDILIFTSPMNVDAWFQKRKHNGEQILAIGNTTSNQLLKYGINNIIVAEKPSEASIVHALQQIL